LTLVTPAAALAIAAAAGLAVGAAGEPGLRRDLPFGATGLVLALLAAAAPNLFLLGLIVLVAALLQARLRPGGLPARAAALGAGLAGLSGYAASGGGAAAGRVAALAAALAICALAGLMPLLGPPEPDVGRPAASPIAWSSFLGPALALAVFARTVATLPLADDRIFGGLLLALGSLNVLWGVAVQRRGLLADWGFALIGLGLLSHDGAAGAYLLLLSVTLLRLPWLLWRRRAGRLAQLALAGGPPFAAFAGRILVLRAATATGWPFAAALAAAMLALLALALRDEAAPGRGRRLVLAEGAALVLSAAIGIYPELVLRPVGLG